MATSNASPSSAPARSATPLTLLRVFALVTAVGSVVQAALGLYLRTADAFAWHATIGAVTLASSVVAAVGAYLWSKRSGNKGILMHAAGVAVLALLQYALGELGWELAHTVLGLAFLIAAVALVTLAFRKPGIARASTA